MNPSQSWSDCKYAVSDGPINVEGKSFWQYYGCVQRNMLEMCDIRHPYHIKVIDPKSRWKRAVILLEFEKEHGMNAEKAEERVRRATACCTHCKYYIWQGSPDPVLSES